MDVKGALLEWGLSDKEIEVYLVLLRRGQTSVQDIAKNSGVLRQSVYDVLDRLSHLGLISEIVENKKTHFSALSPEKLKEILDERKEVIDNVLPELLNLENKSLSKLNVQVFRGLKALKSIFSDPLNGKEILSIQPIIGEEFMKEFYIGNFVQKRLERKIPIKIIREETRKGLQEKIITNKKEFREVRIVKSLKDFKTHIIIYSDKVMLNIYRDEPVSILIKDSFVAESFRLMFGIIWESGKEI
tara:strand:+ start:422 stop:1153 length:732 start_codon:yes stop_codon:yes gene_type:complete